MKKCCIFFLISVWLILLFTGCAKQENKQIVKPFENIPVDLAKSVNFSNYTLPSKNKEVGRSKIVTEKQDMEDIVRYIKTISCTKSTQKIKAADYEIRLSDDKGSYMYSIGVSKNQIYMYGGINSTTVVYDYSDTNVIKELIKIYKVMNYSENLIYKK